MLLYLEKVFTDVIKSHSGDYSEFSKWALRFYKTQVSLCKRGNGRISHGRGPKTYGLEYCSHKLGNAGEARDRFSPRGSREIQTGQHLDFSPVILILDLWPPELDRIKVYCFQSQVLVTTTVNRKLIYLYIFSDLFSTVQIITYI